MGISSYIMHFLSVVLLFVSGVYGGRESPRSSKGLPVMYRHGANYDQLFEKDQARVDLIQNSKSEDASVGYGQYTVTVEIGTPKQKFTLILDTGSDVTWIQSNPCPVNCKGPLFDPNASSTLTYQYCPKDHEPCSYQIPYDDSSYSEGYLAKDTLTLQDSGTVTDFLFGCGHNLSEGFDGVAGVFGLSKGGEKSIVSQSELGKHFCYCLSAAESVTGYLHLGEVALSICHPQTFTPLLPQPINAHYYNSYYVGLAAITIGTKRLAVASSYNTILDSGTVFSRLPPSLYSDLSAEFKRLMSPYTPVNRTGEFLDTCYNLDDHQAIPKMALHFEGADVDLDMEGVIQRKEGSPLVCLGFAPNTKELDLIIIGNNQQKTLGILYDIPNNRVGFITNAC